jgi:salicylate hydroxylase
MSARLHGVEIITNARTASYDDKTRAPSVQITTTSGEHYLFDLVVGADGIKSQIRTQMYPNIKPVPYAPAVAYRHTMKISTIYREIPESRHIIRNNLHMWCGPHGYIVTYPLSGGTEMNITICFYTKDGWPTTIVEDADLSELNEQLKGYPELIQKIWALAPGSNRWPLMHIPKMDGWSNASKNVVLLGDACHAMNPALAQGAATAIEDAAFLGQVLREVRDDTITLPEAINLYERQRIPKAWIKQQLAFVAADLEMGGPGPSHKGNLSTQEVQELRDRNSEPEIEAAATSVKKQGELPRTYRSWHHVFFVDGNKRNFYYDAEADADDAVCQYLLERGKVINDTRRAVDTLEQKFWAPLWDNGVDDVDQSRRRDMPYTATDSEANDRLLNGDERRST